MKTLGEIQLARGRRDAVCGKRGGGTGHRDPVVARHDRRQQRCDRQARQRLQCQPEGLQGRPELQRRLRRHHECRHRRVPRRPGAAHHAGVRGRHGDHDGGDRRRETRARADEGVGRDVRSQGLPADHHRLLLDDQGRDAVVPVQLVEHGDVVQQGQLQEGGPRSRKAAQDLARGVRGGQEAQGVRPSQLRLRQCLGDVGQRRAALRLA